MSVRRRISVALILAAVALTAFGVIAGSNQSALADEETGPVAIEAQTCRDEDHAGVAGEMHDNGHLSGEHHERQHDGAKRTPMHESSGAMRSINGRST